MPIPIAHNSSKTKVNERDEWKTPPDLFEWLNGRFNFDIDLAATTDNALCDKFLGNSLPVAWNSHGDYGFCNPPFSMKSEFIEKALSEVTTGFTTVMLLPFSPETSWWRRGMCRTPSKRFVYVTMEPRLQHLILYPRVNYIGSGGGCPFVTCAVVFNYESLNNPGVKWATWK